MAKGLNIIAGLRLNTSAFTTSLKGASVAMGQFTAAGSKGMAGLATASNFATIGFVALLKVMQSVVSIIMDYSKALSELKAVSGASADEIQRMSQLAQELGATTVHTASEVVKLMTVLARLGFNTGQIENMTESILHLGTAMGIDLKDAAELTGSTMRAFGLDASQATRVADVLARSTTLSSLSFNKLRIALPYAATAAKQAGYTFERTSALLAVLANSGLRASTIGTSMRKIFIKLAQKGLTLNEALDMVRSSTNKMATATKLFGVTAANSASILADNADKIEEYNNKLLIAEGTTKRMADIMADNLSGDLKLATSAWTGLVLAIDEGEGVISTTLRDFVQNITSLLTQIRLLVSATTDWKTKLKILWNGIVEITETALKPFWIALGPIISAIEYITGKEWSLKFDIEGEERIVSVAERVLEYQKLIKEAAAERLRASQKAAEAKQAELDALAAEDKELQKNIETWQSYIDKWYLATLTGKAYKDEQFAQWYDNEKKKLDALTISTEKYNEGLKKLNETAGAKRGAGDVVDPISGKPLANKGPDIAGDITAMAPVPTEAIEQLTTFNDLLKDSFNAVSALSGAFDLLGDAISDSIEGQEQVFANVTVGILKSINKIINALLAEMIIGVIAHEGSTKGIWGLAAAAIALPIAIGGMKALINKNKENYAQGGIVPGTSFSGDQVVAGLNSREMVLTQAQQANLFAMANGAGGGAGGVVEFEIRGDKLVGVLSNYNRKMNKIS